MRQLILGVCCAVVCGLVGCGNWPTEKQPRAAKIEISHSAMVGQNLTARVGDTLQLTAVGRDAAGNVIPNVRFTWAVSPRTAGVEPGEATITSDGRLVGVRRGYMNVTASTNDNIALIGLYVRSRVTSLRLLPDSIRIVVGDSRVIADSSFDASGTFIPARVPIAVATSDAAVASVDTSRRLTATGAGHAAISITADGVTATMPVTSMLLTFSGIGSGGSFTCGLTPTDETVCWGNNRWLQVGSLTDKECLGSAGQYGCGYRSAPIPKLVSGPFPFRKLSSGPFHTCALTNSGAAYCWGKDDHHQLGTSAARQTCNDPPSYSGSTAPCTGTPLAVDGTLTFASISAGTTHTCGVMPDGSAYCWGENTYGALGDGSTTSRAAPVAVTGGLVFRNVSAGNNHTCGVTIANQAYCWGRNTDGALGLGSADTNRYSTPVPVAGGLTYSTVSVRGTHTCALTTAGRVYCWGRISPANSPVTEPQPVASDLVFTSLALGSLDCAMTNGTTYCWIFNVPQPAPVTAAPPFRTISGGCGVTFENVAYCWDLSLVAKKAPGQQ
jgi:alpha-tubulin suppressor-like RCC1 family protein